SEKSSLSDLVRELQGERETLAADLAVAREEIARLERDVSERERSLDETREETHKTIVAEAEETERLRAELEVVRAESERALGAERAEVARLREELLS